MAKKIFWSVRHTVDGTDGPGESYFTSKEAAEKFSHNHCVAGGGADNPRKRSFDTEKHSDKISEIENIMAMIEYEAEANERLERRIQKEEAEYRRIQYDND